MSNDRLYTEKEISKILKRAGEIQAAEREKVTIGLSLEEIQQLAEEVGLEPDIIASVAEYIDVEPEKEETGFFASLMMPTKIDVEQVIQGEITEEDWPEIVSLIERTAAKSGASSQIGRMLEWTSDSKNSVQKLSVIPGDNQTKVIFQGTFTQLALAWTLPIVINVGVWAFILGMINLGMVGIPIGIGVVFATYLIILSGFKSFMRKKKQSIKSMFAKLKGVVTANDLKKGQKTNRSGSERIHIRDAMDVQNETKSPDRKRVR